MFTTAFPDIDITVEDMIAEADRVAFRIRATGTHEGSFMDVDPTGKTVTLNAVDIHRFDDGKVVEEWLSMDLLGVMEQLEAV